MLTKIHLFFISKHPFIKNNKIPTKFICFDLKFKSIHDDYVGDSVQFAHGAGSYLDEYISLS